MRTDEEGGEDGGADSDRDSQNFAFSPTAATQDQHASLSERDRVQAANILKVLLF